jgi:hypothetical protein
VTSFAGAQNKSKEKDRDKGKVIPLLKHTGSPLLSLVLNKPNSYLENSVTLFSLQWKIKAQPKMPFIYSTPLRQLPKVSFNSH